MKRKKPNAAPARDRKRAARLFAMARGQHRQGNLNEAARLYQEGLAHDPDNVEGNHMLGVAALQARAYDVAVAYIHRAISLGGRDPACHRDLAFALARMGRVDEGLATVQIALSLGADPEDAVPVYTAALEVLPDHPGAQERLYGELLRQAERRAREGKQGPGRLVLGIGTGRSGSTSLVALLRAQADAVVSHEHPPRLPWKPHPERFAFHRRCFEALLRTHAFVGDVSHWWLPYLDQIFEAFPGAKVVALKRDREQTVRSFEKVKGSGERAVNHWHDHGGRGWRPNPWDECYPSYGVPDRREAIGRYWDDYYQQAEAWQARRSEDVLVLPVEVLDSETGQDRLFGFLGMTEHAHPGAVRLNVGTMADGIQMWR